MRPDPPGDGYADDDGRLVAHYRCAFDVHWTDEYNSDEIEAITGYPASDFEQARVRSWTSIMYPEDRSLLQAVTRDAVRARRPFETRYRIVRADGALRWVVDRGGAVFEDDGSVRHIVGTITDDGPA